MQTIFFKYKLKFFKKSFLRSIWSEKVFKSARVNTNVGNKTLLQFNFEIESIVPIINSLKRIQLFMRDHAKNLFAGQEFHSAVNLMVFMELLIEIFSLFEVLSTFPIHQVFPEKFWQILSSNNFQSFLKDHVSFSAILIEHLLLFHISNDADITALNAQLTSICPQLYCQSDAMFSRATQSLNLAANSLEGKEKYIAEAFGIYKSIINNINLNQACFNLLKCQAFVEIGQLCFQKAKLMNSDDDKLKIFDIFVETLAFISQIKMNNQIDESIAKYFSNYSKDDAKNDVPFLIFVFLILFKKTTSLSS